MLDWVKYRYIRKKYFGENISEARKGYSKYMKARKMINIPVCEVSVCAFDIQAAPQPTILPRGLGLMACKQEGKTPMSYEKSDTATQRDYLLQRLAYASSYDRVRKFRAIFNTDVNNVPKTYKELIDAIKNDKFTLDTRRTAVIDANFVSEDEDVNHWFLTGPFDGIIWNGPQPDKKGYEKAIQDDDKQFTMAKDIIMTGTAAEGLKALQEFEAWTPAPTTSVA